LCFTGDLLDIYGKEENGWWFGKLNGKRGHFPSTYVEELPVEQRQIMMPDII